ncbi:MAG: S9 family peptidase [Rickettsiaceae bacterium]|nr:S9 family peptidase [Rickettsiaceae bacterium]
MNPPIAEKVPFVTKIHNQEIIDEYHWMRDPNWPNVQDKKILSYLEAENKYTESFISSHKAYIEEIFEELKSRIKLDDVSLATKKENYYYYSKTFADKNYPIYCRKQGSMEGDEEVILDVNILSKDKTFTRVSGLSPSPSQTKLAYAADFNGSENYTIYVKDLSNEQLLSDKIVKTIGVPKWHEDESGFFYTPVNENWRHDKVMFHKLGTKQEDDILVMHEPDVLNQLSISKSSSKKYIFIESSGHDSTELYYFSMEDKQFAPIKLISRKERVFYTVDHAGEYFYVHTNDNGPNFRLARIPVSNLKEEEMDDYLPHDEKSYLSSVDVSADYIVANYKKNGLPEIVVIRASDKESKIISFPDEAFVASGYAANFEENEIRINYSSLKRPEMIYGYDYNAHDLKVLKVQEIPSGFNPDEYEVRRVWASNEGVEIPVTIFYKKSLFKGDGTNPLYLYGYGSYGISVPPSFRNSAVTLANRGFVYAVAHIRGGDDLGYKWYESSKFLTKKNTFNDFIASAHYLTEQKYTSAGNIVISGGSAGGMLIGCAINMEPSLFKAAVAHVPFVDVLNTMLDESLPLTPGEFKEWGNPKEKEYFEYIKSYSPYDNVSTKKYPSLFITAGISDPRVTYWEAAKWTAKLRAYNQSTNHIYLKVNMTAGHQGASGRFDYLKEAAEEFVFVLTRFGL